jgi:hypothetical protein
MRSALRRLWAAARARHVVAVGTCTVCLHPLRAGEVDVCAADDCQLVRGDRLIW